MLNELAVDRLAPGNTSPNENCPLNLVFRISGRYPELTLVDKMIVTSVCLLINGDVPRHMGHCYDFSAKVVESRESSSPARLLVCLIWYLIKYWIRLYLRWIEGG